MESFQRRVAAVDPDALCATGLDLLQLNVGLRCNMSCGHCHQTSSPAREEQMGDGVFEAALGLARRLGVGLVDVTGGAPELHPAIRGYLEALRVIARVDVPLFREIVDYSGGRFPQDKASYHISVTDDDVTGLLKAANEQLEQVFLNEDKGRQVLHVTFGSVLTMGKAASGRSFKEAVLEILHENADLHADVLEKHLGKHLRELRAG